MSGIKGTDKLGPGNLLEQGTDMFQGSLGVLPLCCFSLLLSPYSPICADLFFQVPYLHSKE